MNALGAILGLAALSVLFGLFVRPRTDGAACGGDGPACAACPGACSPTEDPDAR